MTSDARRRIEEAAREGSEALARAGCLGQGTTEQRAKAAVVLVAFGEGLIREAAEVADAADRNAGDYYRQYPGGVILSHFGLGEEEGRERNG